MDVLHNINSKTFTLSAIVIGYILIDDATPAEQNSLGNWFMMIGQVLCTNSAQQQVLNNKNNTSNFSNRHIINDDFFSQTKNFQSDEEIYNQILVMQKVVNAIQSEINNLKGKI